VGILDLANKEKPLITALCENSILS
jgi:hypothetical protein